ncbi:hypothetical protein [Photobacterium ganghwense]|uniref:hypothetical protein n=1 Tax=Photobacterium ganghwense TaxID=320778 RepID=UPI001A907F1A|nr:hypothetical protein [Photobacterium ganghwense]QSV17654.1 hypothetical protein FH974_25555 [Photobacterium ganghwense]
MKNLNIKKLAVLITFSGVTSFSAHAFDSVYWEWNANVDTSVTQTVTANTDLIPTGLTMVENEQLMLGTVTSISSVTGVENISLDPLLSYSLDDLAKIESTATAVGNNASIESDVKTDVDSSQTFGGVDATLATGLTGTLADITLPGIVSATSTVIGTINASVDSSATAVANNLAIDLTTTSGQDAFLVANNTQTSVANVNSLSTVDVAVVTGYSDLGTLADPFVSSVATSVGNNLDVKVDGIN